MSADRKTPNSYNNEAELANEIKCYAVYKNLIRCKYDRKPSLRYKCELNHLNNMFNSKLEELNNIKRINQQSKLANSIRRGNIREENALTTIQEHNSECDRDVMKKYSEIDVKQSQCGDRKPKENHKLTGSHQPMRNKRIQMRWMKYNDGEAAKADVDKVAGTSEFNRIGVSQFERFKKMSTKWSEKTQ